MELRQVKVSPLERRKPPPSLTLLLGQSSPSGSQRPKLSRPRQASHSALAGPQRSRNRRKHRTLRSGSHALPRRLRWAALRNRALSSSAALRQVLRRNPAARLLLGPALARLLSKIFSVKMPLARRLLSFGSDPIENDGRQFDCAVLILLCL